MVLERGRGTEDEGGRVGGLDGIRALAVLAVIVFHSGMTWLAGGYLGVDAFFVLSGFLITSLLVADWAGTGGIGLRRFWARRARRLLPALFAMLAVVGVVAARWPSLIGSPHLVGDAVATLLYVSNWHFALQHANYFSATASPSPLIHTWTLGVEEQFYLVWPLVVLGVATVARRRRPEKPEAALRLLLVLSAVGAVASALEMAWLAPGPTGSTARVYFGTDTRAQDLLVGAALAAGLALWRRRQPVLTARHRQVAAAAGLLGLAGVGVLWAGLGESNPLTFRGGFFVVGLGCAEVIACCVLAPTSPVARLLSLRPLRYVGRISYGMYLWYMPVLVAVSAPRTGLRGVDLLAVRLAVITALAATSFRFLEMPIRRGSLAGWRARLAVPAAVGVCVSVIAAASATGAAAAGVPVASLRAVTAAAEAHGPGPTPTTAPGVPAPETRALGAIAPAPDRPVRILLVGDSMAGTFGVGLSQVAATYGAEVVNRGEPGCSASTDQAIEQWGQAAPPGSPCVAGQPGAILQQWATWVAQYQPDVVVYLARAEVLNQEHDSQWGDITQPAFASWVQSRLAQAVSVLGSGGAPVVLLTSPLYDSGTQASGAAWPEDDPARAAADDHLMEVVAAGHGTEVSVIDAGGMLSPGGRFAPQIDGLQVRCNDGIHLTAAGGAWLGARILPQVVALAQNHLRHVPQVAPVADDDVPSWYSKVPCGPATLAS